MTERSYIQKELAEWILKSWDEEVKNRPIQNIYRRMLDSQWRRVYSKVTGGEQLPRESSCPLLLQVNFKLKKINETPTKSGWYWVIKKGDKYEEPRVIFLKKNAYIWPKKLYRSTEPLKMPEWSDI